MTGRYEVTTEQWKQIKDFLPGKKGDRGRTASDNRTFVNGVLWILRSGARWSDLPCKYGKYKSTHQRFSRWAKKKIWEKIFRCLIKDKKNFYIMLDITIVKAHSQAATFKKKTRLWGVPEEV